MFAAGALPVFCLWLLRAERNASPFRPWRGAPIKSECRGLPPCDRPAAARGRRRSRPPPPSFTYKGEAAEEDEETRGEEGTVGEKR